MNLPYSLPSPMARGVWKNGRFVRKLRIDPFYDRRGADWIFWWGHKLPAGHGTDAYPYDNFAHGYAESGRWITGTTWHSMGREKPWDIGRKKGK